MRRLPNIISVLRIAGSACILFCYVTGWAFGSVYLVCGFSDMADGWLARRLDAETKTGALLDSMADICFVVCCCYRLLPVLEIPLWLWMWAGMIVMIKVANQVSALVMYRQCCFPHTMANKVTGFLLFLAVPMTFWSIVPISIVAGVATFAAIEEGHVIRTKKATHEIISSEHR